MNGSFRTQANDRLPTTPRRDKGRNVNAKIESIAIEFGLPIKIGELSSPSERHRTEGPIQQCKSSISFLFFKNGKILEDVLQQLRHDLNDDSIPGDVLTHFLGLLIEAVRLEKMRCDVFDERKNFYPKQAAFVNEVQLERLEQTGITASSTRKLESTLNPKRTPKTLRQSILRLTSAKLKNSQPKDSHEFAVPEKPSRTKKRPSEESLPDAVKQSRREGVSPVARSRDTSSSSRVSFSTNTSTFSSARTSFSTSAGGRSFASTVPSSVTPEDERGFESSSSSYGALDISETETLMTSFDHSSYSADSFRAGLRKLSSGAISAETSSSQRTIEDAELGGSAGLSRTDNGTGEAETQLVAEHTAQLASPRYELRSNDHAVNPAKTTPIKGFIPAVQSPGSHNTKSARKAIPPEPHLIRDLPQHGLFTKPLPGKMLSFPLPLRWECLRVAQALSVDLEDLSLDTINDECRLYELLESGNESARMFSRTPASIWETTRQARPALSSDITYKGKLIYTPTSRSRKSMFTLNLHPLQCDHTSRLQRIFGAHRFLYLDVPNISRPTSEFRGHTPAVQQRFREWLSTEKEFLGYQWRPFHVQANKGRSKRVEHVGGQRIVLFATHGPDLKPVTLHQLLNCVIPLDENARQPFCKAYARLDLFLSRSIPTVKFKPSQVQRVKDVRANKEPEDIAFNDPAIPFPAYSPFTSMVMNDGCCLMSVGAAKEMCNILGLSGIKPVTFQGRINGCKGMWTISAPYDSTDPHHQDVWIQITDSQQKIFPRGQDLDPSTCDADRWTFDLVKYSTPPTMSNLYLDFMPILEDRHVPRDRICEIVTTQLEMDFKHLFNALDSPAQLRRWVHSQYASLEENSRLKGITWDRAFPSETFEKVIFLLDSGFHVKTCLHLAVCLKTFIRLWTHQLREKLKIRLPKSTSVYGIADPTGCLKPGEVYLRFSETFRDETTGDSWSSLRGEVLVARHPSLRRSDIQKVKAVYKEELSHLVDVIVFPTRGFHPLADKLQGGDYDGDTFWICWDDRITELFMNAPAPDPNTSLELQSFCIKRDDRRLKEILGPSIDDVDSWLSQSFGFKLQEDMLGKCTNAHKRLAYCENSIHTPGVRALVDLHDLIMDSAKNGYEFDSKAFARFKKKRQIKDAPKPAYEEELKALDDKSARYSTSKSPMYNPNHIIDKILFEIVNPRIAEMQKHLDTLLKAAHASDDNLAQLYRNQEKRAADDHIISDVLKKLVVALDAVILRWNRSMNPATDLASELGKQVAARCNFECYGIYRNIQPSRTDHSLIHEWIQPRIAHEPTTWDLLKASAFYYTRHMESKLRTDRSTTLVFYVAGRELCYLKAMSQPGCACSVDLCYSQAKKGQEGSTRKRDIVADARR